MLRSFKIILTLILFFPAMAFAHSIAITATVPFPPSVSVSSTANATFTVTNIAAKVSVTVIDQSLFPAGSGLLITVNTCGVLLQPGQSCMIQVTLNAPATTQIISTALKEWAKPTVDAVQYPIVINIAALPTVSLVPVNGFHSSTLPALRSPVVAQSSGNWLIVSGSFGNFHDFGNTFTTDIYVYNPTTMQMYSIPVASTDLPVTVRTQLTSMDPEVLQDGNTLYIIGGYYTPDDTTFTTLNTITSINVSGMMNAVMNGQTALAQFVNVNTSIPQFQVTGGQLGKIGNNFYLAYGQNCEGRYCGVSQTYTDSVYEFTADPSLSAVTIINTVTHPDGDGSGWRRRDYSLLPFMLDSTPMLFAEGGPFTPGSNALVWTNGITFNANLQVNNNFLNQQANQYNSPFLSIYSANRNISYAMTFSGLSNLYWTTSGLTYDNETPYGNVLDVITHDSTGSVREFANTQPLCSGQALPNCLYMGLTAAFIPSGNFYDSRGILQLDQLAPTSPNLVGYIYGGLLSPSPDIFGNDNSYATNQVYAVYVTPAGSGSNWQNITNLYPGN